MIDAPTLQKQQIFLEFKKQAKCHIVAYKICCLLYLALAITSLISSSNLAKKYDYYIQIQYWIIIIVSLSLPVIGLSLLIMRSSKYYNLQVAFQFLQLLLLSVVLLLLFLSIIMDLFQVYCDYFFRHEGYTRPYSIIFRLQSIMYDYPSCNSMQSSDQSVHEQLMYYSKIVITKDCAYSSQKNCEQFNTLRIDNWNDMFGLQLASLIMCGVWYIAYAIVIILLRVKYVQCRRQIRNIAMNAQHSINNQVLNSQVQNYSNQPVVIYSIPNYNPNQQYQYYQQNQYQHSYIPQGNISSSQQQQIPYPNYNINSDHTLNDNIIIGEPIIK